MLVANQTNISDNNKRWLLNIGLSMLIILLTGIVGYLLLPVDDDNASSITSVIALSLASVFLISRFPKLLLFHSVTLSMALIAILLGIALEFIPFGGRVDVVQLMPYFSYNLIGKLIFIILLCLVLPVAEEIYFRGLLYPLFSSHLGSVTGAILTVIIFTLFHMPTINTALFILLSGSIYTWLVYRSRSVIPGIIAHCINNICWFILAIKLHE